MAAISITDLNNAKTDVDHIATIATSLSDTATDRLGHVKQTIAGAIGSIAAITNRGAWVTATAYSLKDLVSESGTWYICVVAHTSSAAFSTDSSSKWRVYQGVISVDLADDDGVLLVGNAVDKRSLTASTGASLIGWIRSATSAVATTLAKRLGWQAVSPLEFMTEAQRADVLLATPLLDHTAAIQAALDASLRVDFGGAEYSYKISNELTLRTGHSVRARKAKITQTATRTAIFRATSKTDICIKGFNFVGVGSDFNNSPSSLAVAVRGTSVSRMTVKDNYFSNFSCAGVFLDLSLDCSVSNNVIIGPGSPTLTAITSGACYGIVLDGSRMSAMRNNITQTAIGIATGDGAASIEICSNIISNIVGQHGIYAGAGQINLVISGNAISSTTLMGIKVQNYDTPALNADNISIFGNTISSTGSDGIAVLSTTASAVYKLRNVSITGNAIRNASEDGINLGDITIGIVTGNTIYGTSREGITLGRLNGVKITANMIREATHNGIRESAACTGCTISENDIQNCSSALATGEKNGILIQFGDTFVIDGNVVFDSNSKMQYGIFISGGTQTGMAVRNNICRGMTDYGARFKSPVETILMIGKNYFSGTLGAVLNDPSLPSVASASTITLPLGTDVVLITGTTTINNIVTSGHVGHLITLLFNGSCTVTRNGANIQISASFVATQYDSLTIYTDGTLWYEAGRSVN